LKAIVFGASAGLGRALAERLAVCGYDLLLVASDAEDLRAMTADLALRHGIGALACPCSARADSPWLEAFAAAAREFGTPDALLLPVGASREDDDGLLGLADARALVETNFLAVTGVVAAVVPAMLERGSGVVVGFGSIASARGRRRNAVYAAAKRALESYFESLRHRAAAEGVRVQYIHLGYLSTQQTYGKRLLLPAASPEGAAARIVARLQKRGGAYFLPGYWRGIAFALRLLPWPLFRRLSF
jgi:short-subunit dehydrogenase